MVSYRQVIFRAARRVGLSSLGESVGRAVNVLLPFVILYLHSVDGHTDAFFLALAVSYFVQGTLGNVVASIQVIELVRDKEQRSIRRFSLLALGTGVTSGCVVYLLGHSFWTAEAALMAAFAVSISATAGLVAAPATAVLNSEHRYLLPGLTWAFRVIPVVAYFLWSPSIPELGWLLLGIALADALRAVLLFNRSNRRLTFSKLHRALEFPLDAMYLLLSTSIAGLTPLAARWIASWGDPGNVSIFDTADRVYGAVASLATIGMGSVVLVYLSRISENKSEAERAWKWTVHSAQAWGALWTAFSALVWFSFPLAVQWFPAQTEHTFGEIQNTFLALSIGLPAFVLGMVYSRRILTLGLARSLLPMALIGLACSVSVGFFLFERVGTAGIAIGVASGQYLVLGLMIRCVRAKRDNANLSPL